MNFEKRIKYFQCCLPEQFSGKPIHFAIEFLDITNEEKKAIKRIIQISDSFSIEDVVYGGPTMSLRVGWPYRSFRNMYHENNINYEAIKTLKKKQIIITMVNCWRTKKQAPYITIYFHIGSYQNLKQSRKVLVEKQLSRFKPRKKHSL